MPDQADELSRLRACKLPAERQEVLAELFMKHRKRLRVMVDLRLDALLRGRIDPSDVLQETFLEVSRRLDDFLRQPDAPLFVWMRFLTAQKLQALHRHHLGVHARDARKEISLYHGAMPQATSEALAAQLLGKGTSPSDAAVRAELQVRLQEALNSMDPLDREILALRHFEQLSNAEAAQVLAIEKEAARKRYFRALKRLKKILTGIPGAGGEEWI